MIIPLGQPGEYRLTCMSCEEQRIIEGARNKEDAQRIAIFHRWSRAAENEHECPRCTATSIERFLKN